MFTRNVAAKKLAPTPAVEEGPYYKEGSPGRRNIAEPDMSGKKFILEGRVKDTSGLQSFKLLNGAVQSCEVIDIALSGVALRTAVRPEIGEHIQFGNTLAEVVRHLPDGIGVKFIGLVQMQELPPKIT